MVEFKLWVDDVREPPDETWDWVTTSEAAIAVLRIFHEEIGMWCEREAISLDYDLGGDDTTRSVVLWMIENGFKFNNYYVHTANPVGRDWLEGMLDMYLRK